MPGLISRALVIALAITAGMLLIGLLWIWPRLAGSGPRRVALRVLALCVVQASMLSLTFVLVNRANGFYASWSDMLGRYTGGGTLAPVSEGTTRSSGLVSVLASRPVLVPGRHQPAGTLQTVLIRGELSGLAFAGHIYLPPGYPGPGGPGPGGPARWYPVIVTMSASQRGSASPYAARRLAVTAAMRIMAGKLQPVILVMLPAGTRSDPGCLDMPGGPQAALFFTQDLRTAIGSDYRVAVEPSSRWALLGDASGGYCALQLALTNAATFAAAAVPPGAYRVPPGPRAWGRSPQLRAQDNLLWLVRHQPMQPISVLFTGTGSAGPFLSLAHGPMRAASAPLAAGHWPLAPALDWLGRALRGAARWG